MVIKILGMGCPKCKKLEEHVRQAVKEIGIEATIEKVQDVQQIMAYGVMQTPALVVDEKVVSYGKVLTPENIKQFLKK